jgi:ribosomal protein L44E
MKKIDHRLHRLTQRGWHPQPIIAAGIRKFRRRDFGMSTRFCNIVIKIKKKTKIIHVICEICGLKIRG